MIKLEKMLEALTITQCAIEHVGKLTKVFYMCEDKGDYRVVFAEMQRVLDDAKVKLYELDPEYFKDFIETLDSCVVSSPAEGSCSEHGALLRYEHNVWRCIECGWACVFVRQLG